MVVCSLNSDLLVFDLAEARESLAVEKNVYHRIIGAALGIDRLLEIGRGNVAHRRSRDNYPNREDKHPADKERVDLLENFVSVVHGCFRG
jgi:hypothetical protein